ncbi:hypothetical protein ACFE04_017917 [Oxalis oulophora]
MTGYDVVPMACPERYVVGLEILENAINKALEVRIPTPFRPKIEKLKIDIEDEPNEMHSQHDDKRLLEGLGCEWNLRIDFQTKTKDDLDTSSILTCEFREAFRAIDCFLNVMKYIKNFGRGTSIAT